MLLHFTGGKDQQRKIFCPEVNLAFSPWWKWILSVGAPWKQCLSTETAVQGSVHDQT